MHRHNWIFLALAFGVGSLGGCKKAPPPPPPSEVTTPPPEPPAPPPFAVKTIDVGKGITADKHVANATTSFSVKDTIYVSVVTDGAAPSKTITARWTFGAGKLVKEQSDTIAPTGPAATEFHITKKTPWPAGKYKVEILVDGNSAGTKEFEVKK
ncbi:MAG TPA: hypothetical protein VFB89_13935 [Gemmatimonadales bacterium]|jgi:hypothetical protein|nr:hypothetical protein [Gemmatimonadales bacterium]